MAALKIAALSLLIVAFTCNAQPIADGYVGSKTCFGCHSAIFKSFAKTDMGRSMTLAKDWKPESIPLNATVSQPGTSTQFSVSHSESGWVQSESDPGVFSTEHPLDYVVGSGYNGLTFLIRRGSYLFQAPLSYYSRAKKWDLSPGYEKTDLGFNRVVPEECINCHSGRPSPMRNASGAYADPPFQELAIGCENCHGPGGTHVNSGGKSTTGIVNPAKLTPTLAGNICVNCHQSGDARVTQPGKTYLDFRPGQWLYDTAIIFKEPTLPGEPQSDLLNHQSAMQVSRCFRESQGKLGCISCHDPHVQPRGIETVSYYRNKCFVCHTDKSCRLALSVRTAQTPSDNCVGCHMPKRDITEVSHSALTNHRIPARPDEPIPQVMQAEVEGLVVVDPPDRREVRLSNPILLRAYQQMAAKNPGYQRRYQSVLDNLSKSDLEDSFTQAALGDRCLSAGKAEEAIEHFKLALPLGNASVYLELAQALAKVGRNEEAIEYLKKAIEIDPYNAVMQKTLILQYINLKSYVEARSLMREYVSKFPEDSFMRNLLDRVGR